jgi:hypothetical protein
MPVVLKINDRFKNREVRFFNELKISARYDKAGSTLQVNYYFNPDNFDHKELSCMGHFHIATVDDVNRGVSDRLFTGFITTQAFKDTPETTMAAVSGYSVPGVLENCQAPPEQFKVITDFYQPTSLKGSLTDQSTDEAPIEYSNTRFEKFSGISLDVSGLTLRQIVDRLVTPFQVKYLVRNLSIKNVSSLSLRQLTEVSTEESPIEYSIPQDRSISSLMDDVVADAKLRPSQSIMSHLVELCSQKGIIITGDEYGRLIFQKPVKTKPITFIQRGDVGVTSWQTTMNGEQLHSHIWAMAQHDDDINNSSESAPIRNPLVQAVFRPKVTVQTSGTDADTAIVAKNSLQEELKALQITITLSSWRIDGKLVRPGQIISILNPHIYIYKKTDLFIDSVDYLATEKEQTATLTCVLPEVYTGGVPISPFAGINIHRPQNVN